MNLRLMWALLIVLAASFGAVLVSVGFAVQQQRHADHRWCAVMRLVDQPTVRRPGETDEQWQRRRHAAEQFHKLRLDLGC